MRRFEVLSHTADIGGRVYGKDIEELFRNAAELLYSLSGIAQRKGKGNVVKIKLYAGSIEELLVKFLNELIYCMDAKKIGGEIKKLVIKKENGRYIISCDLEESAISIRREIKAATYHNLKVKEEKGVFSTDIIFDI